jgi:hypothetical protein
LSSATDSTIRAPRSEAENSAVTCSTVPAAGACEGVVLLARTVMIGVPVATLDCTTTLPPKTGCSAVRSGRTPTASVISPLPVLMARRAATSLPSALLGSSTAAGALSATSRASTAALGPAR